MIRFNSGLILSNCKGVNLDFEVKRHLDLHPEDSIGNGRYVVLKEKTRDELRAWCKKWNRPYCIGAL